MNELYELKEKMIDELMGMSKKDLSPAALERVDKLAHATKNLCKVIESVEGGHSYDDGSYDNGSYRSMGSYYSRDNGNSYARGRGRYAARDSMGRYSSAKEDAAKKLEKLMESAPDERFRQKLQEVMETIEKD